MRYHLYYKADTGYNRSVSFPANELDKMLYAFLTEKRVLLSDGQAVDGKYIQQISPDWNRIMGWSEGYRLGSEEFNEIAKSGVDKLARNIQALHSDRVRKMIETGQQPITVSPDNRLQLDEGI